MMECIEFEGCLSKAGYGVKRRKGKNHYAHRLAYIENFGEIPEGLVVRHKCDNRACINHEHLVIGTQMDNVHDCIKRGRDHKTPSKGESNGFSKLTNELVLYIRKSDLNGEQLAKELNLNRSTINRVRSGKTWTHVKEVI